MDATAKQLKELTEADGVPGFESNVRAIMTRELKKSCDSVSTDRLGSVFGVSGKTGPRVMVDGHMDEIGFLVKSITKDGFLKFLQLGGWWGHVALAQRFKVLTQNGPVIGVVGSTPPHMLDPDKRKKVLEVKELFLDIGSTDGYNAAEELGVRVGDPIVPVSEFTVLGNDKLYLAKAFDNRMACSVVLDVAKAAKKTKFPNRLIAAASVQEEVGLRGAQTLAWTSEPDVCIAIDTGIAQDIPTMDGSSATEKLTGGPSILVYDGSLIPNVRLRDLVIETAEKKKIPFHLTAMERGGEDGGRISLSRSGVASVMIGPPVRYIHSHNGIMHRDDYDSTVKLVTEVVKRLDAKTVKSLYA